MEISVEKYMTGTVAVVMNYQVKTLKGETMAEAGQEDNVRLRIASDGNSYRFEYALNGLPWQLLAEHDCPLLSTEMVGGFTGAIVGMYAEGEGTADFSYFKYSEK